MLGTVMPEIPVRSKYGWRWFLEEKALDTCFKGFKDLEGQTTVASNPKAQMWQQLCC